MLSFFDFHNIDNDTFLIQNHILLLLKLYLCNATKYGFLSFNNFLNEISKIKNLEQRVAENNQNKCERFRKKWRRTVNKVLYDLIRNKQKNQLYLNLQIAGRWYRDWVVFWGCFFSFLFISFH